MHRHTQRTFLKFLLMQSEDIFKKLKLNISSEMRSWGKCEQVVMILSQLAFYFYLMCTWIKKNL